MKKHKRSFFERLTGSRHVDDMDEEDNFSEKQIKVTGGKDAEVPLTTTDEDSGGDGELAVDVHQTSSDIVIKTMVAGVKPEDLEITMTRDMVTIRGKREGERMIQDQDYFHKELYWGSFSRTISLPQEVEPEEAEAIERHGLLTIRLPKIDRNKKNHLKVKSL